MHRRPQPEGPAVGRSRLSLLVLLCVAQLIVIIDISAVNVALPDMAKDLEIGGGDVGWVITSYSLIFGSLLLLGGRAADLLGRRRVFLTGLTIFTVSSLASALAAGAGALFAARAGQGLGAALLSPAALSIIMSAFPEGAERAKALGAWGAVGGAGAAVGVLVGGTLTELVDWRLIFLINLPVGLALAAGVLKIVPADSARPRWSGLDLPGAMLATLSVGALVFAASEADGAGWTSTETLGLGSAALAGLVGFAALELRTRQPLLRVQRLADRGVGGGSLMMLAVSAVLFGAFLLMSLYMQNVLGTGAMETGLAFLPMAAALALGVHAGGHLISRGGVRIPMAAALAVATGGMLLLAGVDAGGSYVSDLLPGMLVAGVGLGAALVAVSVAVMTGAPEDESGMLSGLNTTGHEIGGSLGVAVLATIATGALGAAGGPDATAALAGGISDGFMAAGVLTGIAGLLALAILPSASSFLPKLRLAPPVAIH
jgi:EmrB/QacA subfamily drug resistance transporter